MESVDTKIDNGISRVDGLVNVMLIFPMPGANLQIYWNLQFSLLKTKISVAD